MEQDETLSSKLNDMTESQKKEVKTAIEEKLIGLTNTIEGLRELTKPMGLDSAIGRVSRMDYINNKAVSEAGLRTAELKKKALERWLSLYETDQFGKCSRCGNEIDAKRLLLIPESARCIHCAGKS